MTRFSLAFCILVACSWNAVGQTESKRNLVQELLAFPAPPPHSDESRASTGTARFRWDSPPPDDAPLEVLGLYWGQIDDSTKQTASQRTRERLVEACAAKPELTVSLLKLLPESPKVQDLIKQLYDENGQRFGDAWRDEVKNYLKLNSKYFREELVADAKAAADDHETGSVAHEDELRILARLDWKRAEPILEEFAQALMPRRAVLAKTLLFLHNSKKRNESGTLLDDLKKTVEDRKASGYSRDRAADALLSVAWPERDEWFLKLFSDPTLRQLHDGFYLRMPLVSKIGEDPDHWIPIVTKLVSSSDRAVHDNAVECLIHFQLGNARRDALTPLLPWLFDPKWSSASDRLRLIQSMERLDMRESVPGLIAVLNQPVDEAERAYAAESLTYFRDSRAAPELRKGMGSIGDTNYRRMFIAALIASGGMSDTEAASAVEEYVRMKNTPKGSETLENAEYSWPKVPLSVPISIGQYLAEREAPSEGVMSMLLSRAEGLVSSDSQISEMLRDVVHRWPSIVGDRDIARQIQSDSSFARSVAYALLRRDSFTKNCSDAIAAPTSLKGTPAGIFAVLSGDHQRESDILTGSDGIAIQALFAGARLVREPLPLDQVERIYDSGDTTLEQVSGAYLIAEDSPRARQIFHSRSKGLVIVGARQAGADPGHHSYSDFDTLENKLVELMSGDDAYDEALALLSAGYWGDGGQIVIGRRGNESMITYFDDSARRYRRRLGVEELKTLQEVIESEKVDDLGPLNQMVFDGMQFEYVHLTKNQGRRVFMNNPGSSDSGGSVYDRLCISFEKLLRHGPLTVEYPDLAKLPGFEVLIADRRFHVLSFWKEGNEERLRIYPGRNFGGEAVAYSSPGSTVAITQLPEIKGSMWVSIVKGALEASKQPATFPADDPMSVVPDKFQKDDEDRQLPGLWALTNGSTSTTYRAGEFQDKQGLWKFQAGKKPRFLTPDVFSPVISSDGKWAVVTKRGDSSKQASSVVRVNLNSGAIQAVDVPEAERVQAISYVSELQRFLVTRATEPDASSRGLAGPDKLEYWLLDAETGHATLTNDEVRPLTHIGARPLQSTGEPGEFWTAIPSENSGGTDIGRYEARSSRFTPLLHVPSLQFNSQSIWVDPGANAVFIVYKSHLLRLSLK